MVGTSHSLSVIIVVVFTFGNLIRRVCLCRSDPTENDSVEGLRPNARGPGLVTFGVSFVSFMYFFSSCLLCLGLIL